MRKHQVTIIDIARELGISKSTVSRALTHNPNVNPETRKKVLEAAKKLEYTHNLLALSLIRSQTKTLGVVIPDIEKPFFASIVSGIQHVASLSGYRVIITQSNESPYTERDNIEALMLSRTDGFLICHTRQTRQFDQVKMLHKKGIPLVSFARVVHELPVPKVVEDDYNGLFLTTEHLITRDRQRIGLLAGPKHLLSSNLRIEGYKAALARYAIPFRQEYVFHSKFTKEDIPQSLDYWFSLPKPPNAIATIYDAGAVSIIQELKRRGISIPKDIAVTGFGKDPASDIIEPSLTTYRQSPFDIGKASCKYMLDLLNGKLEMGIPSTKIISGELLVRNSS